jgi:membrane fusion protein (multidrug efflux system)
MAAHDKREEAEQVELKLADGTMFRHPGKIAAIEAEANSETGNIAFRADFPNPDGLLRHGQTGTVLMHRILTNFQAQSEGITSSFIIEQLLKEVRGEKVRG